MMKIISNNGVVVWGAGGHARVVHDILALNSLEVIAFIDDTDSAGVPALFCGLPVFRRLDEIPAGRTNKIVVAIGNNTARKQKGDFAEEQGFQLLTLVHPQAIIAR